MKEKARIVLLCEEPPGEMPRVRSRHRTQHTAFRSIKERRFNKLRKMGWRFFIPLTDRKGNDFDASKFKPGDAWP